MKKSTIFAAMCLFSILAVTSSANAQGKNGASNIIVSMDAFQDASSDKWIDVLSTDWGYTEIEWTYFKTDPPSYTETQIEWTYNGPKKSGFMKIEFERLRPNGTSYTEIEWTYFDKNGNGSTSVQGLPAAIQFLESGNQVYMKIEMEK